MDWIGAIEKVGLAATLLIAVLWCIYQFANYFTKQILIPVKDAHIEYLRDTADLARTQKDSVNSLHGKVDTISERVGDIHDLLRDKK